MTAIRQTYPVPPANKQQGVALIVTLVILVVVTFIGLVAMRSGLTHLAMATNSQVNVILFQSADAGVVSLENKINSNVTAANGPTGVITLAKDNPGTEVLGCLIKTGIDLPTTMVTTSKCKLDQDTNYSSGRDAVFVQTALVSPVNQAGTAQAAPVYGSDDSVLPGGGGSTLVGYATSVLPAFGNTTASIVTGCLGKPQESAGETVTDCLTTAGASFQTVVQEYVYGYSGYK